jgi:hypothetical protein
VRRKPSNAAARLVDTGLVDVDSGLVDIDAELVTENAWQSP